MPSSASGRVSRPDPTANPSPGFNSGPDHGSAPGPTPVLTPARISAPADSFDLGPAQTPTTAASPTADRPETSGPPTVSPSTSSTATLSPPSLRSLRELIASKSSTLDPGRPGLRVLLAIGALAVAAAAFFVWRSNPSPQPLAAPTPITPITSIAPSPQSPSAKVTVHVAGKIRKPGVYLLPSGARVTDAVTAAGGVTRGASTGPLNLARRLIDGEQIVVGATSPQTPLGPGAPVPDPATAILDLNSATTDQLEQLPGVGEVLAARIFEFRTSRGGFTTVEQLREVSGIGPRKFAGIKPKVRV